MLPEEGRSENAFRELRPCTFSLRDPQLGLDTEPSPIIPNNRDDNPDNKATHEARVVCSGLSDGTRMMHDAQVAYSRYTATMVNLHFVLIIWMPLLGAAMLALLTFADQHDDTVVQIEQVIAATITVNGVFVSLVRPHTRAHTFNKIETLVKVYLSGWVTEDDAQRKLLRTVYTLAQSHRTLCGFFRSPFNRGARRQSVVRSDASSGPGIHVDSLHMRL